MIAILIFIALGILAWALSEMDTPAPLLILIGLAALCCFDSMAFSILLIGGLVYIPLLVLVTIFAWISPTSGWSFLRFYWFFCLICVIIQTIFLYPLPSYLVGENNDADCQPMKLHEKRIFH